VRSELSHDADNDHGVSAYNRERLYALRGNSGQRPTAETKKGGHPQMAAPGEKVSRCSQVCAGEMAVDWCIGGRTMSLVCPTLLQRLGWHYTQ